MTGAAAYAQRVRDERERFRVAQQLAETEHALDVVLEAPEPETKIYSWDYQKSAPKREAKFLITLISLGLETIDSIRSAIPLSQADAQRLGASASPAMLVRIAESRNLRREVLREFDKLIAKSSEVTNDGCKKSSRGSRLRIRRLRKTKRNNGASLSRTLRGSKGFVHLRRSISA